MKMTPRNPCVRCNARTIFSKAGRKLDVVR